MGKKHRTLGATLLSATFLMSLAPGAAQAAESSTIYMNPNAGITKLWKTDPAKYGNPVSPEKCVKGKGCEQVFEKSVITWNSRNGVKVLTGAERAQAFEKAGGIGTVGALEGDAWNNAFCGPSVTTFDGKTRHLVVVGGDKATIGSSIDLNSVEGKQWIKDRATSKKCFTSVVTPPAPGENNQIPTNIDWSKASHEWNGDRLTFRTDTTSYVVAADANLKPKAGATVYEVPLFAKTNIYWNNWERAYQNTAFDTVAALGMPVAQPAWQGKAYTQQFEGGTVTYNPATGEHSIHISLEGAKAYSKIIGQRLDIPADGYTGNLVPIGNHLYAEKGEAFAFIYDSQSGEFGVMDNRVYDEFLQNPSHFGTWDGTEVYGDGRGGPLYNGAVSLFTTADGKSAWAGGEKTQSVYYTVENADGTRVTEHIDREPVWIPTDPAKVDWSKAHYYELPGLPNEAGGALFYQDGPASSIIIKANADGTPKAGAAAYRSDWLGYFYPFDGRFTYNDFSAWSNPTPSGDTAPHAFLGVPLGDGKTVVENGITYQIQKFEHGSIKWEVPVGDAAAKDAVVTLDAETQKIYDARLG